MPGPSDDLTPLEAAHAVREAIRYEEGLTARTVGLTMMAWGVLAFGLVFVSFALAAGGSDVGPEVGILALLGLLLGGIVLSNALWRSRALTGPGGVKPVRVWSQGLALLVVGFVAMVWIDDRWLPDADSSVSLAFVATLLLGYLGVRLLRAPWAKVPWALLGAFALAIADVPLLLFAPESLPEPDGAAHMMAAVAIGLAVFLPGYAYFRQG